MPTYAIGDVQGCLQPLKALLQKINFNPQSDQLWFAGDIVNRGPESLATLRFISSLPNNTVCVLGNHDIGLLAQDAGALPIHPKDTLQDIFTAPDKVDLLNWLRHRPILHHDPHLQYTLVHAGIYPKWDLSQAQYLAIELETLLQNNDYRNFMSHIMGNQPLYWQDNLSKWDRARFILNAFTRMRFVMTDGALNFTHNDYPSTDPKAIAWFEVENRQTAQHKLIFGHWAALGAQCHTPRVYPIDSGCVWGNFLTAFCLETEQRYTVAASL
jgi:bis(5'-nucleosyl)-tetraphosphatase (symmetrical)